MQCVSLPSCLKQAAVNPAPNYVPFTTVSSDQLLLSIPHCPCTWHLKTCSSAVSTAAPSKRMLLSSTYRLLNCALCTPPPPPHYATPHMRCALCVLVPICALPYACPLHAPPMRPPHMCPSYPKPLCHHPPRLVNVLL